MGKLWTPPHLLVHICAWCVKNSLPPDVPLESSLHQNFKIITLGIKKSTYPTEKVHPYIDREDFVTIICGPPDLQILKKFLGGIEDFSSCWITSFWNGHWSVSSGCINPWFAEVVINHSLLMRKLFNINVINLKTEVESVASLPRAVAVAQFV